ncbi:hypothetical protein ACFYZ8_32495 [Streptomyces sp. NPDC001668]|uniref:hypothetical protein n=1 Tax=unclassified Streptomyces TaxID=2593676 RepID=UPI0036B2B12C
MDHFAWSAESTEVTTRLSKGPAPGEVSSGNSVHTAVTVPSAEACSLTPPASSGVVVSRAGVPQVSLPAGRTAA